MIFLYVLNPNIKRMSKNITLFNMMKQHTESKKYRESKQTFLKQEKNNDFDAFNGYHDDPDSDDEYEEYSYY